MKIFKELTAWVVEASFLELANLVFISNLLPWKMHVEELKQDEKEAP